MQDLAAFNMDTHMVAQPDHFQDDQLQSSLIVNNMREAADNRIKNTK